MKNTWYIWVFLSVLTSFTATAAREAIKVQDKVVYTLYSAPNKITRYDIQQNKFLGELALAKVPTAFALDSTTIYVAYHRELYAIDIATGDASFIRNSTADIQKIAVTPSKVHFVENDNIVSIDKNDTTKVNQYSRWYRPRQLVYSSVKNAFYYRDSGVSPSDIHKIELDVNELPVSAMESPYHGDYPSASELYLNASENKIYDNSGTIYFTSDLTYAGSLSVNVDLLTFIEDNPVVANGNQLHLFSPTNIELGQVALDDNVYFIVGNESEVIAFIDSDGVTEVKAYDVSSFSLPKAGEPGDPHTSFIEPELYGDDGMDTIYMLDHESLTIYRWSLSEEDFLSSWALIDPPAWMTVSNSHQRLYLGYPTGKVTYFDLTNSSPEETHFTTLATGVRGLISAGNYLFAADGSGAWNTHYTFDQSGTIVSSDDWRNTSSTYLFNDNTNRVYHYRDGTSPNDLEWAGIAPETGLLDGHGDSPYHGGDLRVSRPLLNSYDKQLLLNGAGQLLDAISLNILNSLANDISDAVWHTQQLITLRAGTQNLQFWGSNYQLLSEANFKGAELLKMFGLGQDLALLTRKDGLLKVQHYNLNDMPDADSDGLHDLIDNCPADANMNQLDSDADSSGDVCDLDDDNDSIPDSDEIAFGLDPLDAADALLDMDNDGFNNLIEFLYRSDMNDASSIPSPISSLTEDFNDSWPLGFYNSIDSLNQPWILTYLDGSSQGVLMAVAPLHTENFNEVNLAGYFNAGVLHFDYKVVGDYDYRYDFNVLLNGEMIRGSRTSLENNWYRYQFTIPEGVQTLSFRISADTLWGHETQTNYYLDNFTFSPDSDDDGISDTVDNCPFIYNPWQNDNDGDGIGNECDSTPNTPDIDTDGDGFVDGLDNCPAIANPGQENLDGDEYGDVCDQDIDGDGIDNETEQGFHFLDERNPDDGRLDQDNDGVDNATEILNDRDPGAFDEYLTFNLMDYFPLGDITKTYVSSDATWTEIMTQGNRNNEFLVETNDGARWAIIMEEQCLYIEERPDVGESISEIELNNWCYLPRKLSQFQKFSVEMSLILYDESGSAVFTSPQTREFELINFGEMQWQGKTYEFITINVVNRFEHGDIHEYQMTLLKGVGQVSWAHDPDQLLQSIEVSRLNTSYLTPEANQESDKANKSDGGGGSTGTLPLLALATIFIFRSRRRFM
ncbi:hypothetical protein FE810_11660 [Thalassotalea litorea]|uniref:Thrombospondin type 3 repeat-containing protein n=1 Tax=Thalassotalea litorea TaxID=2020715 RepID=A0A5R9II55_9GAMM|nr:thrombospondin type 3 repeat-containing protein [Thalassotalea litorea]TLU64259.1 hypothetical protein FE810_11660 [Thalassotalea litorea]